RVIVRPHRAGDYEAIRHIYAAAFARPEHPESVPWEVGLFDALCEAGDGVDELSFTAIEGIATGHVTAGPGRGAGQPGAGVGPIRGEAECGGRGSGSAVMEALLTAADAADVPMVVLLGSPQYYGRFGFRPAQELGVISPEPSWGAAFQARPLTAYTPALAGRF